MDLVHIAELHPELSARDSKQFRAAVTLIWPYSSSQREFALLLAEPEFRLRRKKGQVRARFSGSSARALATTGVGIGDEVVLSLKGAHFIQDGSVSTPGKSIDWELEYTQNVVVQVFRDGTEIANLELLDAAPTPAPRSPVRRQTTVTASPAQQWSSPVFLKRARLSDGPIFQAPYNPLADENAEGHDKKRRRKSYRDWKAWTYSARTPSPEKGDAGTEDDLESMDASPSRKTQMPHTPLSPIRNGMLSVAAGPFDGAADEMDTSEQAATTSIATIPHEVEDGVKSKAPANDDFVRDNDYFDLYAGPDEDRPTDVEYAFGGDTEVNTEDEVLEDTDAASPHPTEVDNVYLEEHEEHRTGPIDDLSDADGLALVEADAGSTTEEGSLVEMHNAGHISESGDRASDEPEYLGRVEEAPMIIMPPPTLPTLDTSFQTPVIPKVFTPIGKEPSSPTLKPLDSSLLPLPSPFPGERDMNITSYLDHVPGNEQQVEPEAEEDDTSYIMENSFFSSIGSSSANPMHPNHESAFTPVRFTFGMDGAGLSRPLEISSPAPERHIEEFDEVDASGLEASEEPNQAAEEDNVELKVDQEVLESHVSPVSSPPAEAEVSDNGDYVSATTNTEDLEDQSELQGLSRGHLVPEETDEGSDESSDEDAEEDADDTDDVPEYLQHTHPEYLKNEPKIIELSSGSEEESEQSEVEDDIKEGSEEDFEEDEEEDDIATDDAMVVDDIDNNVSSPIAREQEAVQPISNSQRMSPQDSPGPTSTNQSTAASTIVDLGSPSGSSDNEEVFEAPTTDVIKTNEESESVPSTVQVRSLLSDDDLIETGQTYSHSEFIAMDSAPSFSNTAANAQEMPATHTFTQQDIQIAEEHNSNSQSLVIDGLGPLPVMDDQETFMEDELIPDDSFDMVNWQGQDTEEQHPDIKMESIEAGSIFQVEELDSQPGQNTFDDSNQFGEILIEVPEEGHKVGELHTVAVPATGPARNTRSKAKSSRSPTKEDSPSMKRTTRSTRSKASATSVTRTTISPSREAHQTSPYSLRSQSKLLSPSNSASINTAAPRRSPRKHSSQRSVDSIPDVGSQLQNPDPFLTSFMPSQELGASQKSRYSDVLAVKDSEEESLHSEHSMTTVKYSDDWNTFTNFSDPLVGHEHDQDVGNLKPPRSTAPEPISRTGKTTKGKMSEPAAVVISPSRSDRSYVTQPAPTSLSPKLRSASGRTSIPSSPRALRITRQSVRISSSPRPTEDSADETTLRSKAPAHLDLTGEGESNEPRHSPQVDEEMRSSPPAAATAFPSLNQQSLFDSNKLMTPEATQQTSMESQNSLITSQPQQTLPITPQLTQGTSAGLRSFNNSQTAKATAAEPTTESTSRRTATQTSVASPSTTPKTLSPDLSSDADLTAIEKPAGPSIGLSTPIAYYTPLKELTYFLNRSSQFHTASNPDVLALVVSGTTPAVRSSKGRKDWTTTLQVTDASTWPASTTVNIFRPYATALPVADAGDIVLLRAFTVKSLNRQPMLISADESAWCVWRYAKPVWGKKKGVFSEVRAREEVKGPVVERGEGEWGEVEVLRGWWVDKVKAEVESGKDGEGKGTETEKETDEGKGNKVGEEKSGVQTRSRSGMKEERT
jgi:hypothetical protein